jgi:hypothetical protein
LQARGCPSKALFTDIVTDIVDARRALVGETNEVFPVRDDEIVKMLELWWDRLALLYFERHS